MYREFSPQRLVIITKKHKWASNFSLSSPGHFHFQECFLLINSQEKSWEERQKHLASSQNQSCPLSWLTGWRSGLSPVCKLSLVLRSVILAQTSSKDQPLQMTLGSVWNWCEAALSPLPSQVFLLDWKEPHLTFPRDRHLWIQRGGLNMLID